MYEPWEPNCERSPLLAIREPDGPVVGRLAGEVKGQHAGRFCMKAHFRFSTPRPARTTKRKGRNARSEQVTRLTISRKHFFFIWETNDAIWLNLIFCLNFRCHYSFDIHVKKKFLQLYFVTESLRWDGMKRSFYLYRKDNMINSELDFISFRSSFVIFQSFFLLLSLYEQTNWIILVRRTGRDYHEYCERSFIDFIRHRLPRERAQKSNLRKMQIGDSPNFPRLDKLTRLPALSSFPTPEWTGKGSR